MCSSLLYMKLLKHSTDSQADVSVPAVDTEVVTPYKSSSKGDHSVKPARFSISNVFFLVLCSWG